MLLLHSVLYSIFSVALLCIGPTVDAKPNKPPCSRWICQDLSNPLDMTKNDPAALLKSPKQLKTNDGDMFRDVSDVPEITVIKEVHDNGHYTSLCWIEITTITETKNGSKSAIREYAITFETPSDIPNKYVRKKPDVRLNGETVQYKLFDRDSKKSEVVNFTTISRSDDNIVRQNKKVLCGSGPVYTKEFLQWPDSDRKRVEIRVSPKKQNLVATDCVILNATVEDISDKTETANEVAEVTESITTEATTISETIEYIEDHSKELETTPSTSKYDKNNRTGITLTTRIEAEATTITPKSGKHRTKETPITKIEDEITPSTLQSSKTDHTEKTPSTTIEMETTPSTAKSGKKNRTEETPITRREEETTFSTPKPGEKKHTKATFITTIVGETTPSSLRFGKNNRTEETPITSIEEVTTPSTPKYGEKKHTEEMPIANDEEATTSSTLKPGEKKYTKTTYITTIVGETTPSAPRFGKNNRTEESPITMREEETTPRTSKPDKKKHTKETSITTITEDTTPSAPKFGKKNHTKETFITRIEVGTTPSTPKSSKKNRTYETPITRIEEEITSSTPISEGHSEKITITVTSTGSTQLPFETVSPETIEKLEIESVEEGNRLSLETDFPRSTSAKPPQEKQLTPKIKPLDRARHRPRISPTTGHTTTVSDIQQTRIHHTVSDTKSDPRFTTPHDEKTSTSEPSSGTTEQTLYLSSNPIIEKKTTISKKNQKPSTIKADEIEPFDQTTECDEEVTIVPKGEEELKTATVLPDEISIEEYVEGTHKPLKLKPGIDTTTRRFKTEKPEGVSLPIIGSSTLQNIGDISVPSSTESSATPNTTEETKLHHIEDETIKSISSTFEHSTKPEDDSERSTTQQILTPSVPQDLHLPSSQRILEQPKGTKSPNKSKEYPPSTIIPVSASFPPEHENLSTLLEVLKTTKQPSELPQEETTPFYETNLGTRKEASNLISELAKESETTTTSKLDLVSNESSTSKLEYLTEIISHPSEIPASSSKIYKPENKTLQTIKDANTSLRFSTPSSYTTEILEYSPTNIASRISYASIDEKYITDATPGKQGKVEKKVEGTTIKPKASTVSLITPLTSLEQTSSTKETENSETAPTTTSADLLPLITKSNGTSTVIGIEPSEESEISPLFGHTASTTTTSSTTDYITEIKVKDLTATRKTTHLSSELPRTSLKVDDSSETFNTLPTSTTEQSTSATKTSQSAPLSGITSTTSTSKDYTQSTITPRSVQQTRIPTMPLKDEDIRKQKIDQETSETPYYNVSTRLLATSSDLANKSQSITPSQTTLSLEKNTEQTTHSSYTTTPASLNKKHVTKSQSLGSKTITTTSQPSTTPESQHQTRITTKSVDEDLTKVTRFPKRIIDNTISTQSTEQTTFGYTENFTPTPEVLKQNVSTPAKLNETSPTSKHGIPIKHLKTDEQSPEETSTDYFVTTDAFGYTHIPSTTAFIEETGTRIVEKDLCNSAKQKIQIKVKILMEHIIEGINQENVYTLPIMGIEKKTDFDIHSKTIEPDVPNKKLNQDWDAFLDDLAKNYFSFNKNDVPKFDKLVLQHLNLKLPEHGFDGKVFGPNDSHQKLQYLRNLNNQCFPGNQKDNTAKDLHDEFYRYLLNTPSRPKSNEFEKAEFTTIKPATEDKRALITAARIVEKYLSTIEHRIKSQDSSNTKHTSAPLEDFTFLTYFSSPSNGKPITVNVKPTKDDKNESSAKSKPIIKSDAQKKQEIKTSDYENNNRGNSDSDDPEKTLSVRLFETFDNLKRSDFQNDEDITVSSDIKSSEEAKRGSERPIIEIRPVDLKEAVTNLLSKLSEILKRLVGR